MLRFDSPLFLLVLFCFDCHNNLLVIVPEILVLILCSFSLEMDINFILKYVFTCLLLK